MGSFTGISSDGYNALYKCKPLLRCRQARHFGVCCWVLTALICDCGKGTLTDLCPSLPATLTYWTLSRLVRSGQWDQDAGVEHLAHDVLRWLPPPADGVPHLSGDNTRLSGLLTESRQCQAVRGEAACALCHRMVWGAEEPQRLRGAHGQGCRRV